MQVLIVEDEKLASERLQALLTEHDPSIAVCGCLESVEETVSYLRSHPLPDLILMDIHLSDGHSFDIFKKINCTRPVIFITAYDNYVLDAFKILSLDYILKPVSLEGLASAINKFRYLASCFSLPSANCFKSIRAALPYKKRFLGRVGQRLFFIDVEDVALFEAENKIVNMVDKTGNRYVIDYTIEKLETDLDPQQFFRLNRSVIVNISAIEQARPYYNNRLRLLLKGTAFKDHIVVSRDRVGRFKLWAAV